MECGEDVVLKVVVEVTESNKVWWGYELKNHLTLEQIALAVTFLEKAKNILLEIQDNTKPIVKIEGEK